MADTKDAEIVKAEHGDHTGRPPMSVLYSRITKKIQEDPRFDTDSHGQPEGSPGDVEPYCVDCTVPDDKGKMFAIIRKDNGDLVKHGFTYNDNDVTLDDGDSEATAMTPVYAEAVEAHDDIVRAKEYAEVVKTIVYAAEASTEFADVPAQSSEFMWMPKGVHTIQAHSPFGGPARLTVKCNEKTATVIKTCFERIVRATPNRPPFGDIAHKDKDGDPAAFWPKDFSMKDDGVYCKAEWTELGLKCIRGKTYRSFSPCFSCDADWVKAVDNGNGMLVFPEGARGSASNPAEVTGVSPKSVGGLTNWPAFKAISPVKAQQADPQPAIKPAEQTKPKKAMKLKFIKASSCGKYAAGSTHELDDALAALFVQAGDAATPEIADRIITLQNEAERTKTQSRETSLALIGQALVRAQERGAVTKRTDASKATDDEGKMLVKATGYLDKGVPVSDVVDIIDGMPSKTKAGDRPANQSLFVRSTAAESGAEGITRGDDTLFEACDGIVKAYEPMVSPVHGSMGLVRAGQTEEAIAKSRWIANKYASVIRPVLEKGGDFSLMEIIKAADVTDANLGTIATGLLLMRDLGYLKAKLIPLMVATTDLSAEPVKFKQPIITRYKTPPSVLTFKKGLGYTKDAVNDTVRTTSDVSTTDVTITMQQNQAVCVKFDNVLLGSTMRNLFGEQQPMEFYALAKAINKHFIAAVLAANWAPLTESGGALTPPKWDANKFNIPSLVTIKNKMTLAQIPDEGRKVLLHSFFHDILLQDSNLLTAYVIKAALQQQSNPSLTNFGQMDLPILFGLDVHESQLFSDVPYADTGWAPTTIGAALTEAAMLFVSRTPIDYTQALPGVPATAAISVVTEPDSNLSMLFSRWVDNAAKETNAECAIMYQAGQGHPGQGFLIQTTAGAGGAQN